MDVDVAATDLILAAAAESPARAAARSDRSSAFVCNIVHHRFVLIREPPDDEVRASVEIVDVNTRNAGRVGAGLTETRHGRARRSGWQRALPPQRASPYCFCMGIELPADLPAWLGWILFAATALFWLLSSLSELSSESRLRAKSDTETLKLKLDMLRDHANAYREQLESMSDALQADAHGSPTDSQIEAVAAIGEAGVQSYAGMAKHLRARADARKRVPQVVERLSRVQYRQVELSREIGLGVAVEADSVGYLRKELERVGGDVLQLIQELSDSPRIIVGEGDPLDGEGDEGDIYLQIPVQSPENASPEQ